MTEQQLLFDTGNLEAIAYQDPLLGLPNLHACLRDLQVLYEEKARGMALKIYLEDYRVFNETFGHQYGDNMLRSISQYLAELAAAGRLYRTGGVEFVLLLEGAAHSTAVDLADEICNRFSLPWHNGEMDCVCAASMGLVRFPDMAPAGPGELLGRLEYAVNEAASMGSNQAAVFDTALAQRIYRRSTIARCLQEAVRGDALEIRYRPTYHMEENKFTRAETYLCLSTTDFGPVYQDEFLPVAEAAGLVCGVNTYVIRKVCAVIAGLVRDQVPFENISVAISPILLLQEGFVEQLTEILAQAGIPPHTLALEVTESALITANSTVNITMQELQDMGVELILANFGTGYSGITSILDLPIDTLKLDRLFVWQLDNVPQRAALLGGLTDIARKLGLKVIAEGVETQEQIEMVTSFGCDYQQGFYYSPTIDARELGGLLGKSK